MSDAMTDIARDQERSKWERSLGRALIRLMLEPCDEVHNDVLMLARKVDMVPRGYWRGPTSYSDTMHDWLKGLQAGKAAEWVRLFQFLTDVGLEYPALKDLLTQDAVPFCLRTRGRRTKHARKRVR